MAEIDTSSYPRPTAQPSLLSNVQQFGAIQQQKQSIDQAKLDQANQALGYMVRAMGSLGPNASKEDYAKAAQNAVDQGLVPQQQENVFLQHLQNAPDSPTFYKQFMSSAMEGQKQIELHTGINSQQNDQSTQFQGKIDPLTGGFKSTTQLTTQLPPGTRYNEQGQEKLIGASGPSGPIPTPKARPSLPVASPAQTTGPTGPTIRRTDMEAGGPAGPTLPSPNQRVSSGFQAAGLNTAPPPLFEEGAKALTADQALAAQKMTAVKPALEAMKILPGLRSGPSTAQFNNAVAFLKANNLIPTDKENDPTVVYQEANKYLSQYLKGRGDRSDADLAAAEKSSPNVGTQLNPALVKLTRTAIAQDRIEAARANTFTKSGRKDYQNYGEHRATFPQSIDDRAFGLDIMPEGESTKLVD
ncbi:MAG TPA: hypothetical protein VEP90_06580, partial [Methylomirabilota bacterium]|nr:hypothetical protein [Methylomirabilota bacterium]